MGLRNPKKFTLRAIVHDVHDVHDVHRLRR